MIKALVASIRKDNSYIRDDENILNTERKINENIIAEISSFIIRKRRGRDNSSRYFV